MAVRRLKNRSAYGMEQSLLPIAPLPIIAQRAPTARDQAEIGTLWVDKVAETAYSLINIVAGQAVWVAAPVAGAGSFTSVTVNPGDVDVTAGDINVDAGDILLTSGDLNLAAGLIDLGATQIAATGVTGPSFELDAAGLVPVTNATATEASPTFAATINANVGVATFTGFTTAAGASQDLLIVNSLVTTTSAILVTALNGGGNDAQMTITRVEPGFTGFQVTLVNNGAAALNGDILITFWVLS